MKSTIITIIFLILFKFCFSAVQIQLPEEPWEAIVYMENHYPDSKWEADISIKLFGNYSVSDSLMIENSVRILNELSETVELNITSNDRGNLEVFFLDSTNEEQYKPVIQLSSNESSNYFFYSRFPVIPDSKGNKFNRLFNQAIHLHKVPDEFKQNFLTNIFAHAMYPQFWNNEKYLDRDNGSYKGPISTHMQLNTTGTQPLYNEFSEFDQSIIKAVYAKNYSTLLPIAKKKYSKFRIPSWLSHNSIAVLTFPFILVLFLFAGLFILLYKKLFIRIKNKFLQFNTIAILALPTIGMLLSLFSMFTFLFVEPVTLHFNSKGFLVSILASLIIGLPAVNIFRLIEIATNRKTQHKYLRTLLLFLSTSLIPGGVLLSLAYFAFKKDINNEGIKAMIIIFLVFVFIGIIRALISFFVLKEKELKIENDVKLAHLRELKTKAELNALHSKINPHFLYNSLNSIAGLAKTDTEKTEHMALSLSKLFRYSINKEQSDWSTFEEEIEMVKIYFDIEKVRFDDRFEFTISLPDDLKTIKVPRFIIQPLAENAIKHGISKLTSNGEVNITVCEKGKWIEIMVGDNGPDFPKELAPGFGLQSIYDKLEILFSDRFELHFMNTPNKQILLKLAQ